MPGTFELYPDVKVIVVAHLYGTLGKIDAIKDMRTQHDATESLRATYKGTQTRTFGTYNAILLVGGKTVTGNLCRK